MARLNRAVFLDRDGTINEEVSYLADLTQLRLIEGASAAIGRLNQEAFKVVVVSNQSGVARGYLAEDSVQHVHSALRERLERAHAQVDAFYYCPHHPTEGIGPYRRDCGSLGIAVGYPNILWSMNHYYPQEHPHDYPH
jgi:D-glycero-D-manno-heptose 1,7-bisphosphate phosphatase